MSENLEIYKILVVGLEGEERSKFVEKISNGKFLNDTKDTIGVEFNLMSNTFELNGKEQVLGFQFWDMNKEIRYKSVREYYIAGTQGLILCTTKGDINEINYLNEWIEDINKFLKKDVPKILVRITTDLKENKISEKNRSNIEKFIKKWNIDDYFEIATITGDNYANFLDVLAKLCYKNYLISKKAS